MYFTNFLLTFSLQQICKILLAFIALGNAEIMEFDICPKDNPYKFKNGKYCCSEPIQKEFDQCDGVEEKCHNNSGCDDCKFCVGSTKPLNFILFHKHLVYHNYLFFGLNI